MPASSACLLLLLPVSPHPALLPKRTYPVDYPPSAATTSAADTSARMTTSSRDSGDRRNALVRWLESVRSGEIVGGPG